MQLIFILNLYNLIITEPIIYKKGNDFEKCLDCKIKRDRLVKNAIKNDIIVLYNPNDYSEFIKMYEKIIFNSNMSYYALSRYFNEKVKDYLK